MRPAVHMPEVAMMTAGPFMPLMAIDSSTVRTTRSEGNFSSAAVGGISRASASKHSRWRRKTSFTSAAIGLSRNTGTCGNASGVQQPPEVIDQLLRPLDGEDRNDEFAPLGDRLDNHLLQLRLDRTVILVNPVAVGRFHHDVVGLGEGRRVADDRPVPLAHVAGEDDPPWAGRDRSRAARSSPSRGCGRRRGRRRGRGR